MNNKSVILGCVLLGFGALFMLLAGAAINNSLFVFPFVIGLVLLLWGGTIVYESGWGIIATQNCLKNNGIYEAVAAVKHPIFTNTHLVFVRDQSNEIYAVSMIVDTPPPDVFKVIAGKEGNIYAPYPFPTLPASDYR